MKPSEVAIIVGVVLVLGYFFFKNRQATTPPSVPQSSGIVRFVNATTPPCGNGVNPTNAQTPIYGPTMYQLTGGCEGVIPA